MPFKLLLGGGTLLMIAVMLWSGRYYNIHVWKRVLSAIILTLTGLLGTKILALIETGSFAGRSFFGAVLFTPFMMIPVALLLRVKIPDMLDLCAPSECMMLAFMKVHCYISGCCYGMIMYRNQYGKAFRFPSQIVECVTAILLMSVLLIMMSKGKGRGKLYAWYLLLYGILRFILNLFRETTPWIWILPAGNVWSLVSIFIGGIILLYSNKNIKEGCTIGVTQ